MVLIGLPEILVIAAGGVGALSILPVIIEMITYNSETKMGWLESHGLPPQVIFLCFLIASGILLTLLVIAFIFFSYFRLAGQVILVVVIVALLILEAGPFYRLLTNR